MQWENNLLKHTALLLCLIAMVIEVHDVETRRSLVNFSE